nr:MAK10-like protein [Tanacetum cinerariifolium]
MRILSVLLEISPNLATRATGTPLNSPKGTMWYFLIRHDPVGAKWMLIPRTQSDDPNQHLKDFLKLVGSLDRDGANRERTPMHLFQFSLHDQASSWLKHLPARSISTWEDLTTRFLA